MKKLAVFRLERGSLGLRAQVVKLTKEPVESYLESPTRKLADIYNYRHLPDCFAFDVWRGKIYVTPDDQAGDFSDCSPKLGVYEFVDMT